MATLAHFSQNTHLFSHFLDIVQELGGFYLCFVYQKVVWYHEKGNVHRSTAWSLQLDGERIKNGINMSYFNDVTEALSMERLYLEKLKTWKTSKTKLNFSVIGHITSIVIMNILILSEFFVRGQKSLNIPV